MAAFAVRESRRGDAVKFAYTTRDGEVIESVLLYDGKRRTACISSQLGCALGCVFCATGAMGFKRNLSQGEIVGQLIAMNEYLVQRNDKTITNIVFMGMGEALLNFDAFASAADIIMHEDGLCLGARRITVSTAGVVPGIYRLRDSGLPVQLAISLNSYSDQRRSAIMPINKTYPLRKLITAARDFAAVSQWPVTFEYVVIGGENDTPHACTALAGLLRGIRCKINLISLNPGASAPRASSGDDRTDAFGAQLRDRGFTVTIRQSRGRDIDGACGQLAGALTQQS
jgi:23S rRNA (adenine2503-C2)-methyltransferase